MLHETDQFIVWDESFMIHRYGFEVVSKTSKSLREYKKKTGRYNITGR